MTTMNTSQVVLSALSLDTPLAADDRYDGNGIDAQGLHAFFTKEGRLREGLEFLTEKPKQRAPWEKA